MQGQAALEQQNARTGVQAFVTMESWFAYRSKQTAYQQTGGLYMILDTDITGTVRVKELITCFGIVIVFFERCKVLILRIGQTRSADAAEDILFTIFRVTFRAHFIAAQGIEFKFHFLDTAAARINIVAECAKYGRILIGILVIFLAEIRENLNNSLLLVEDFALEITDFGYI